MIQLWQDIIRLLAICKRQLITGVLIIAGIITGIRVAAGLLCCRHRCRRVLVEFIDDFSEDTGKWTYTGYGADAHRNDSNEYVVLTEEEGGLAGVMLFDKDIQTNRMVVEFSL